MGLLTVGSPLDWDAAVKYLDHVRKHGIVQLLSIFEKHRGRTNNELRWGDEIEYMVVRLDPQQRRATLALRALEIIDQLEKEGVEDSSWKPEYAMYMLESTPSAPFGHDLADFYRLEVNMKKRRESLLKVLKDDEVAVTFASFPRLGVGEYTSPHYLPNGPAACSLFIPDELIMQHPRFTTLSANIRKRRGHNVTINVPVFRDEKTKVPVELPAATVDRKTGEEIPFSKYNDPREVAVADGIYMDAMAFGMGCSCLQVTFQARDMDEARYLYDQLTVMAPIMIALTGASPIYRGMLSDIDTRWSVIAASVDDRTPDERGSGANRIPKSRYDSVSMFIASSPWLKEAYNDLHLPIHHETFDKLKAANFPEPLCRHFAHFWTRDPLVIFEETLEQDDENDTDHFENIQSTNWQTVRFKPPPTNSPIGWRTEFRPMEVQLTEFENAAFTVFIVLLTRVIISYKLNLYMPLSKVDENMKKSQNRGAAIVETFYFPTKIQRSDPTDEHYDDLEEMSVNEIINGGPNRQFPGLIALMKHFLNSIPNTDVQTRLRIEDYLTLISKRASGELMTMAAYTRAFVAKHPSYKKDSVVPEDIVYDLTVHLNDVVSGKTQCPEMFGDLAL